MAVIFFVRRRYGTKCGGCSLGIKPQELVRKARDKVFHLNCFTCMMCRKQLSTGEELYILDDNKFICKQDFMSGKNSQGKKIKILIIHSQIIVNHIRKGRKGWCWGGEGNHQIHMETIMPVIIQHFTPGYHPRIFFRSPPVRKNWVTMELWVLTGGPLKYNATYGVPHIKSHLFLNLSLPWYTKTIYTSNLYLLFFIFIWNTDIKNSRLHNLGQMLPPTLPFPNHETWPGMGAGWR